MANPEGTTPAPPNAWAVLRLRNARLVIGSRMFAFLGRRLIEATLPWQVYDLTGSAMALGVVSVVQFLPVIPMTLWGGAVADAFDRRKVALGAEAAILLGWIALACLPHEAASLPWIYAIALLLAVAGAFESPAGIALLPQVVPRELFPHAVTLSSTLRTGAGTGGLMLAGFAIDAFGPPRTYGIGVGIMALCMLQLAGVRVPIQAGDRRRASLDAVREGVRFVFSRGAIWSCMTLDLFAVVFASVVGLLPMYQEILGIGPRGYGLLVGAMEAGTLMMGGLLMLRPPLQTPGRALLLAVGAFGLATVLFAVSRSFPLSLLALLLAGAADQISMVTRSTIVQLSTPDALRGRVNSVNMIFINASNQLGAAESSFLAAFTSAPFSAAFGGLACLAVVAWIACAVPALRTYRVSADEPSV